MSKCNCFGYIFALSENKYNYIKNNWQKVWIRGCNGIIFEVLNNKQKIKWKLLI